MLIIVLTLLSMVINKLCVNNNLIILRVFSNQHDLLCLIHLKLNKITLDDIFKGYESKTFSHNYTSRFYEFKTYEYIISENL